MKSRRLTATSLGLLGWAFEGPLPVEKKLVVIAAPHTSNWDGLLLVFLTQSVNLDVQWMVKDDWVKGPVGPIIRATGGVGIDRSRNTNMVDQMIAEFGRRERFLLTIPPEGTRARVEHWKSGFYRIALGAGVPVAPSYLDFKRKRAGIGPTMKMTGDVTTDMNQVRAFYEKQAPTPYDPTKFGPIRLREEM